MFAGETDLGEMVAFGSGGAGLKEGATPTDGRTLIDCHAMVIARRALLK